jgi:hypothetical protein
MFSLIPWSLIINLAVAGLVVVGIAAAFPNPVRAKIRSLIRIKRDKYHRATTTPIQRELELIAVPQKVIETAQRQVKDLQGKLLHQRNLLEQRKDDLQTAEDAYFEAGANVTDDVVGLVVDMEQRVAIEDQTYNSIEQAVSTSCAAVSTAVRELRAIQLKVVSDEAKQIATNALTHAAQVIQAAQSIASTDGALQRESNVIAAEFERAQASFDNSQGTKVERELRDLKQTDLRDTVRKRLEERRAARDTKTS